MSSDSGNGETLEVIWVDMQEARDVVILVEMLT